MHDWCARQKIVGAHLNGYVGKQIPTLAPSAYSQEDIDFIVPRVLELTYTSHSLKGWAEALGYEGDPFVFDPERRAILRAELDARYAKLYGLNEQELRYILDPADVYGEDYPSESFRVLKEKEIAEFGEYRTQRMVLDAWHMQEEQSVGLYVRREQFNDRWLYLRTLVGQLITQSSLHRIPVVDLIGAYASLRNPLAFAIDGMPPVVNEWVRQYNDTIRDGEHLESVLDEMFEAGEISISKDGIISLCDDAHLLAATDLPDIAMDARMALAFSRIVRREEKIAEWLSLVSPAFRLKVSGGYYARAA